MGPLGCPETSVRNYYCTLRNIGEYGRSQVYACLCVVRRRRYMTAAVWLSCVVWKRHWNTKTRFTENLRANWRTTLSKVFLEMEKVPRQIRRFPACYGTNRFSAVFTTAHNLSFSWAKLTQLAAHHFLRSILIFSSTPRNSKRSLPLVFSYQYSVCCSLLHVGPMHPPPPTGWPRQCVTQPTW
jgi:hypothetical protein